MRLLRELVGRAVKRGELLDPNPSLLRLQAPAALLRHRLPTHGAPLEDTFVVSLVDDVALPLLILRPPASTSEQ